MSTMQWRLVKDDGLAVIELTGYLGDAAVQQFDGAVGWALRSTDSPIVLDLSALQGWSSRGEQAIMRATARVSETGRRLAVSGGDLSGSWASAGSPWVGIEAFPDVEAARETLAAPRSRDDPA